MNTPTPTLSKDNFIQNNQKIQDSWKKALTEGASLYLQKKQVGAHGIRFSGGNILVPLRDIHNNLHGVQCIDYDGKKQFLSGSKITGHFHLLGSLEQAICVYFAEGYATAATIHEALNQPVVACLSVGNIEAVVQVFVQQHHDLKRIIAADNDWEKAENVGLNTAKKVAQHYGCFLTYPRFDKDYKEMQASDFNDLSFFVDPQELIQQLQNHEFLEDCQEYPEPEPLFSDASSPEPFPVEALPPIIRDAVLEHQHYAKQAMPLVVVAALTQVSFACQGLANVRRDHQLEGPISLNFAAVVPSGGGKTTADSAFSAPARAWQQEKLDDYAKALKTYAQKKTVWDVERIGLEQQLRRAAGKPEKIQDLKKHLTNLLDQEPTKPISPLCLYTDINQPTLAVALQNNRPSAALISDEAGLFIGSNGMRAEDCMGFFSFLNKLWENGAYSRQRLTTADAYLVGRRFTCSLMMQPGVMQALLRLGGGMGREIGFLARMLITEPPSTAGTRIYEEPPSSCYAMNKFDQRIRECLDHPLPVDESLDDQRLKPPVLDLSPQAKALWVNYYNAVEVQLKPYSFLAIIPDFARRSAEQAARLAGCFHAFENGPHGSISEEMMQKAITIAQWFLTETLRFFGAHDHPQDYQDAEALWRWCIHKNHEAITLSLVNQYGPNHLRKFPQRYQNALKLLEKHGYLISDHKVWHINPKAMTVADSAESAEGENAESHISNISDISGSDGD